MSTYSFKKEAKLYLVYGGSKYLIDISDTTFSQTIMENSFPLRTIQTAGLFEGSVIYKANPANFEFTLPTIVQNDFQVVLDRALDCASFDLYIETKQDVFKLEYAVITSASFISERNIPLSLSIAGEASKLLRIGSYGYSIPGTPVTRNTSTYIVVNYSNIILGANTTMSNDLHKMSAELQNNIEWTPHSVSLGSCATEGLSYPKTYTVSKKTFAGSIIRFLKNNNAELQGYDNNTSLFIQVGTKIANVFRGYQFDIDKCSFSNRLNTNEVYTQSYDWRMIQNPSNLADIIQKV